MKRVRIRYRLALYGLLGSDTETSDGTHLRSEVVLPDLPLHELSLWDGASAWSKGTNGDVREEVPEEGANRAAQAGVLTLGYLRPGAANVSALPKAIEAGVTYDRLSYGPEGAARELWFNAQGDLRRIVYQQDGVVVTDFVDELADYQGVRLAKRIREHKSTETNETVSTIERVDLPAELPQATFARPAPRNDANLSSAGSVRLPLALLGGRWIVVQGRLGGKAGTFLLDSGASSTAYDLAYVGVVGAKPKGEIAQAAGIFKGISFVRVPRLEISGLSLAPQTVLALDLQTTLPFKVDGILGYDFLSRFDVTIDYGEGWLTLAAPGTHVAEAGEAAIPFEMRGTSIRVPVSLNGQPAGRFELDTGNGGEVTVHHAPGASALLSPPADVSLLAWPPIRQRSGSGVLHPRGSRCRREHPDGDLERRASPRARPRRSARLVRGGRRQPGLRLFAAYPGDARLLAAHALRAPANTVLVARPLWLRRRDARPCRGKTGDRRRDSGQPRRPRRLRVDDEILDVDGVAPGEASISSQRLLSDAAPGESRVVRVRRKGAVVEARCTAITHP